MKLLVLFALGLLAASCAALPKQVSQKDTSVINSDETDYLISGIIEILLKPLKNILAKQINAIIQSIKDQGGHLVDSIRNEIDKIAELIRPFIISIINRLNDIIGGSLDLAAKLKMAVERLFDYLGIINEANKEIVKSLVKYFVDALLGKISPKDIEAYRDLEQVCKVAVSLPDAFLISQISEHIVRPLYEFLGRQLASIIQSLLDQAGHLGDALLENVEMIAEILRPYVMRILSLTGKLRENLEEAREDIHRIIARIVSNIKIIRDLGVEKVKIFIERIVDIIVRPRNSFSSAVQSDTSYLIIDRIIGAIIKPILGKINSILDQIKDVIEGKTDEAKQQLQKLLDDLTLILRAPVVKIVGVLQDLGIGIKDTFEMIKKVLTMIIDSVKGIHEDNKNIFKAVLSHIITRLMEMIGIEDQKELVVYKGYVLITLINILFDPLVKKINQIMNSIRESISEGAQAIQKYLHELARMISPMVKRVIEVLHNIGVGGKDLVENIKYTLELILDHVKGITQINKELMKNMLNEIITHILEELK